MEFFSPHHNHHQQQQQSQQQQQQQTQPQQQQQQPQQEVGPGVDSSSMSSGAVADAATVAIAKDMLQLHHGGAIVSNMEHMQQSQQQQQQQQQSQQQQQQLEQQQQQTPVQMNTGASTPAPAQQIPDNALGMLKFENDLLYITEACTIIGRNSSTSHVHFHVNENNLVSRKHFQVLYDIESKEFFVQCLSKNGIFVDDFLQRRNADPLKLPKTCSFRFPSTEIRIMFESFVHAPPSPSVNMIGGAGSLLLHGVGNNNNNNNNNSSSHATNISGNNHNNAGNHNTNVIVTAAADSSESPHATANLIPLESSNVIYSPLKISIPKKEQKSPYLSPTGTISAANSCPASPRQGFHQNPNYNNYGNNNLQNQDFFQTPSTASYNHNEKPPYSYAQLIVQAISAAPDKQLTLSGIYSFIVKHYPYYRKETNKGWQNSIRHNLSLNRYFIKVARSQDEPGKGSFWRIDPDSGAKLIDHSYKKRRQRSSQGFRPSYGMPRSAPVSPSHMDNSRESSPLQDIVLQSAPGSPGISLENRSAEGDLIYSSQNMHQQPANNTHHQYNSSGSPYYQNSGVVVGQQQQQQQPHVETGGGGGGNGVGALIALKRNNAMASSSSAPTSAITMGHQQATQQQQQQQQQLQHHPDIIYEEMPTDYSGNMESGDESDAKRPKYISEVL